MVKWHLRSLIYILNCLELAPPMRYPSACERCKYLPICIKVHAAIVKRFAKEGR